MPWPVKYLHDREACDCINEYIWQKYLESGGKKGKIEFTEEFKPEDWPGYIWPFTSIKKAFQGQQNPGTGIPQEEGGSTERYHHPSSPS